MPPRRPPLRFGALVSGLGLAATGAFAAPPSFSEAQAGAGIALVFNAAGYSHWQYSGGGAAGDFNRDGWQDLFLLSGGNGGVPDRLYINNGNGTFTDRAANWGVAAIHMGKGVAVGDYDKDGWPDLYVTSAGTPGSIGACKHRLYRNNGGTGFTEVAAAAGVQCTAPGEDGWGAAFGDYDRDGDVDLFVAGFADGNAGNRLFRNDGDGTFTDVTAAIGLFSGIPFTLKSFAPRFVDMDGDLWPELLVAADFGTSRYFKNDGDGTFTDVTELGGTGADENGMGQCVGDFDGNLLLDWYVTSIYLPQIQWTGNKLYMGQGNHGYVEQATAAGVADGGYGWGAVAVDFNHDTLQDLLETNGDNVSGSVFASEQKYLWMNDGDGTFTEMALAAGITTTGLGRGLIHLDYDNDGDQDVVHLANGEGVRLYRNTLQGPGTHWLRVFLDTSAVPGLAPDGDGSRVLLEAAGKTQVRPMSSGDGYLSHSEMSAHFGVGSDPVAERLEVRWADGSVTVLDEIAANQMILLMADGPVVCSPAPGEIEGLRLGASTDKTELHFTWDDAPDADAYRVLSDSQFSGGFELVVGDATSGAAGLFAPTPPGDKFFLVAGRREGCQGPR
jgi:hypothetical protein